MSTAADIVSRVGIGDVCRALGVEPRRGRIAAAWCETRDRNVSLNEAKGAWFDHVAGEGGGIVDLLAKVRGCSRPDALRWCADLEGVPLNDKPFTQADRKAWARERRAMERDLPAALYWRRTAVLLCDEKLVELKAALFDPAADAPVPDEIAWRTREQARLNKLEGPGLVEEYREAARREPAVTAGKPVGRPRRVFNRDEVYELQRKGMTIAGIADRLGIGVGTVARTLAGVA